MEPAWKCQPINGHRFTWGPASHSGLNWFFTRSQRKKCLRPLWYNWHLGLKVKHWWWQIPQQRSQFSQPNSVRLWSSLRKKANVTKWWFFFINSPSLTELALRPISNYGRVSIKKITIKKDCSHWFQLTSFLCFTFHPNFTSNAPQVWQSSSECMSLICATLPKVCKSRSPICGFPAEPLERATKASNYPWPSGSSSLFLPLWAPAARSTLLSPCALSPWLCLPPSPVQNNPSARLQQLIAAISDKGDVWGETVPKVSQGEGLQHLRVCQRCLESHGFDSSNSLFQGVPFVRKSDAWKPVINSSQDRELTAMSSLPKTYHLQAQFSPCWFYIVCTQHLLEHINKLDHGTLLFVHCYFLVVCFSLSFHPTADLSEKIWECWYDFYFVYSST